MARYDAHVAWFEDFRPALSSDEHECLRRLLGPGSGRCLDLGCGTGVAVPALRELGWTVVGVDVSDEMLARARRHDVELHCAHGDALPFHDASFDAAISLWTHTDIDDLPAVLREASRVLRQGAPFVYIGAHPCFVGPHSSFPYAVGVPSLYAGYERAGRYDRGPAIGPTNGLRARVGATHLPLGAFMEAFLAAGFHLERFEEHGLGEPERNYPFKVALLCRR